MRKSILVLLLLGAFLLVGVGSATMVPFYPDQGWNLLNPFNEGSYVEEFSDVYAVSYNSVNNSLAITNIYVNVDQGTNLDYTLYFNDGSTKTGSIDYSAEWMGLQDTLTVSLDGSSDTRTGPHVPGVDPSVRIGYMVSNNTDYFLRITDTLQYSLINDPVVDISITAPSVNPIIQVNIVSENQPFSAQIHSSSIEYIVKAESSYETGADNFVGFITSNITAIFDILLLIWGYFSFFFIYNLPLTVMLIEMAIVAYRISTSSDVFRAISYIISDNERLLRGIIEFVSVAVSLAWDVVNLINPARWLFGK